MLHKFLLVIGLLFALAACAPGSPSVPRVEPTVRPTPLPSPTPIGRRTDNGIVCPATIKVTYEGQFTVVEWPVEFEFKKRGLFDLSDPWLNKFEASLRKIQNEAISMVENRFVDAMRLASYDIPPDSEYRYNYFPDSVTGRIFKLVQVARGKVPYYFEPECEKDWTLQYVIHPQRISDSERGQQWRVGLTWIGSTATTYLKVSSAGGKIETAIREAEMHAILSGQFDPKKVLSEIAMTDPLANIGAAEYEKNVIETATRIKTDGQLVGRFDWSSIEGQEVVNDILARGLLLKAWTSGKKIHQAVWTAYLRDRVVTSTSVTVSSQPVSGTFFLGIGSVRGGGTNTSFNQTSSSEPSVHGDLYVSSK